MKRTRWVVGTMKLVLLCASFSAFTGCASEPTKSVDAKKASAAERIADRNDSRMDAKNR